MGLAQSELAELGCYLSPLCALAQRAWSIMTAPRVPTIGDRMPRRTAWADLADSSQECSKDETHLFPPAPLVDDSYDTPASGVEGHKDGLNSRFSRTLLKAGPIDFSFLDDAGSPGKKFKAAGSALATHAESASSTAEPPTLNASAPVFVPTASLQRQPTSPSDMPPPAVPQATAKSKRIRGKRALSSLSTVQDQGSQKRNRERGDSIVEEAAAAAQPGQPRVLQNFLEPPPATEEEWQHRIAKRLKVVTAIKETPEYQSCRAAPRTPTAEDRNLSKRRWEYEIQQWRTQLKQLAAGDDAMGELENEHSPEA